MLRFAEPVNEAFHFLLDETLDSGITMIHDMRFLENDRDIEDFPLSSKMLDVVDIYYLFCQLRKHHNDERHLWLLNDYHYLLIYELLDWFSESEIDAIDFVYKGKQVKGIDISLILDRFFWDTDFLIDQETFNNCPVAVKKDIDVSKETFGVINSLKPSLKEMTIELIETDRYIPKRGGQEIFKFGR